MSRWGVLIVLSLSMFIIVIDTTIMNVSIAALVEELDTTVQGIQAAISLYALVMAAFMLPAGKLSDILGKKRTFLIGVVLFGIGTLTASVSQNLAMLIIGWSVIEGLGSALMLPTLQNILRSHYQARERALGYAILGGVAAAGAALGPLMGGFLTTYYSWRWAFRLEVIIVLIVLAMGRLIPKDVVVRRRPRLDVGGVVLNATGMALVVLGVLLSSSFGWLAAKKPLLIGSLEIAPFGLSVTPFLVGAGVLVVIGFFQFEERRTRSGRDVIVDPAIFGNGAFRSSVIDRFVQLMVQAALLYSLPLFMLLFLELNSFETGLSLMPFSLAIIALSIGGTRLAATRLPRWIIQAGFSLAAAGLAVIVLQLDSAMTSANLFLGSIVAGAGFGLIVSQIVNLLLSTVRPEEVAEATGVSSTAEQLGNAIGVALIGSIMLNTLNAAIIRSVTAATTLPADIKAAAIAAAEQDIPLMSTTQVEALLAGLDASTRTELVSIYDRAHLTAFAAALLFLAFMAGIGVLVGRRLPATRLVDDSAAGGG
jgi:MFS family permease